MKILLKILFVLTVSIQIHAQERLINGKVSDETGLPIPGVNVVIKGTSTGISTNFDGLYQIKAKDTDVLVFSYIGFIEEERVVGKLNTISITLKADKATLDEVVIMGYGTSERKSITSSISTVSSESVSRTLSGKVGGVSITHSEPQSGQLTASEINDLEKWQGWKNVFKNKDYKTTRNDWGFYLENKVKVVIRDKNGNPCNNIITTLYNDLNVPIMTSRTDIYGEVYLFKGYENNSHNEYYRIQINEGNSIMGKKITNTTESVSFEMGNTNTSNDIDVMFTIDATGSMGDEIAYLKSELKNIINRLDARINEKRVALTFYRDKTDAYLVRDFDFNSNIDEVKNVLSDQSADGGGDYEEAVHEALIASMNKSWNMNAKSKLLFLVLDAPPHLTQENVMIIKEQIKIAQEKGIKIIPIVASGANKTVEFLMRFFSVSTNGTYVFLTDDSGIGNAHLKPTAEDYKIEKLNDLIVRLIEKYSGVIG
ncbi:carboxypeptidase-like regulatory domain-containing protein [Mariniflexile litorale]|uniref:Carboxypeptidase-like regulatory domain-containing protein n=1 Tax=Mariniflexile litorale TaxID=3045158 RepID=A0AAU7EGC0_9FLAO|nr:carboxypeptidase-like regulatory domain-containing protein [Mariniflexile sp. KMM 9835]MDQ8213168.1 carboxypeptidase-like regulatory domain-containing protein [Mariniflexile sp. KMM 9835]